jgi:branched-chain amino acid transport system permease protein
MNAYEIGLVIQSCISVITVAAVFAMTGLAGMFSLGQAAYMSVGAYGTFLAASYFDLPVIPACILGVLISSVVAYIVARPTLKLRRDYFALLSVGLSQAVVALIITFKQYTNGSLGFAKIPKVNNLIYITLAITILVVFCIRNLKYSRFGRMCIALKNDELAAKSFGIDVYNLKIKVYVVASALAAVAGILYGFKNRLIEPNAFAWAQSAEMQIFLFFGGTNSLTGAVISAFSLKLLPELLRGVRLFGQSMQEYRTMVYCVLIIVVLNFRTQGLFGEKELSLSFIKPWINKARNAARVRRMDKQ